MKKLFLSTALLALTAGAALAADLPTRKEPLLPPPPPPPMWTGFHVGLNIGGIWSNNSLNAATWNVANGDGGSVADEIDAALLTGNYASTGGVIGGGQIGYDYQFAGINGFGIVAGLETDFQGVDASLGAGSRHTGAPTFNGALGPFAVDAFTIAGQQVSASLSYLGTVRGRLGVLVMPTLLVYGTGGFAYGQVNASARNVAFGYVNVSAGSQRIDPVGPEAVTLGAGTYSNTQVGYTVGGGVEWMFAPNWSAKAEYLYYNLGTATGRTFNVAYPLVAGGGAPELSNVTRYSAPVNGNIIRAGVNYHFNFGGATPIVAKF